MLPLRVGDVDIPWVLAVVSVAPELSVKEPELPLRTLVPISKFEPGLTVKFIVLEIVPPVFVNVCVPLLLKTIAPFEFAVSVIVPPVIEKFPPIFSVTILPLLFERFKIPAKIDTSPLIVRV